MIMYIDIYLDELILFHFRRLLNLESEIEKGMSNGHFDSLLIKKKCDLTIS